LFISEQHRLQLSGTKGSLRVVIAAKVFSPDKDTGHRGLPGHLPECVLNSGAIGHAIEFMDLDVFGETAIGKD
jgi:hypothetical protein